jgi:hypothetical protein
MPIDSDVCGDFHQSRDTMVQSLGGELRMYIHRSERVCVYMRCIL